VELAHVDGKVLELVLLRLLEHQLRALAHGVDAAQVAGGVQRWVGRLGERHVWEARGPRAVGGGARGPQRAIGGVGLAAAGRDDGLGAFAAEDSHDGGDGEGSVLAECRRGSSCRWRVQSHGRTVEGVQRDPQMIPVRTPARGARGGWA
jgi:hypothetical protein